MTGGMATLCMSSSVLLNQHQFAKISCIHKSNSLGCKCTEASWEKLHSQFELSRTRPGPNCRFEARVSNSERLRDDKLSHEKDGKLRVGLICGGPSAERGISQNSARSVLDHLQGVDVDVQCFYLDRNKRPYAISPTQMYCNTPSDFDFKLGSTAQAFETFETFLQHLQSAVDIVFPAMHGKFGEDGGIQAFLEGAGIPFVGTDACSARRAFDKFTSSRELSRLGFVTLPNLLVQDGLKDAGEVANWFTENQLDLDTGRVVVKPTRAGSSIGVSVAYGVEDALQKARQLISEGVDDRVLIEIFVEGVEFTAIVLDVGSRGVSHPVVLMPTEIEFQPDFSSLEGSIFDYRKKYLPSRQVSFHTPARFPTPVLQEIRSGAAQLFQQLGLKDFARIDGWYISSASARTLLTGEQKQRDRRTGEMEEGTFLFSDINLISGMEQTSFLFQQAAQVGLSHADVLRSVLFHACSRFAITPPSGPRVKLESANNAIDTRDVSKKKVYVIFGGQTSEKQVSLMSGTNVWLNLRACTDLDVHPFLLVPATGTDIDEACSVWALPYSAVLRHTVEEVIAACVEALQPEASAATELLREEIVFELKDSSQLQSLVIEGGLNVERPRQMSLLEWIQEAKKDDAVVFIAVHGGIGEDGTLQALLESQKVLYTGSGVGASRLCANKAATGTVLSNLAHQGVYSPVKKLWVTSDLLAGFDSRTTGEDTVHKVWEDLKENLKSKSICVKPASDGCSTGVAKLCCAMDLFCYLKALCEGFSYIPPGTLSEAHGIIEMPASRPELLLFEAFIETDAIIVASQGRVSFGRFTGSGLLWEGKSPWVEVTVGVMGQKNQMRSFNPSITVKESGPILSLEEKFQGGTGVNLTPPPPSIMSEETIKSIKQRMEIVATTLGLEGFARIDAFAHADTGEVIVIEVNTIPGMTPSTVLIHQALAEDPPIFPRMFFRHALDLAKDPSGTLSP